MKRFDKLKEQRWFSYTFAGCVMVVLYLFLSHFASVWNSVHTFLGYFQPVIIGAVMAFIMNSIAGLFRDYVFDHMKSEKKKWLLSVLCTVVVVIILMALLMLAMIPQLIDSITMFAANINIYVARIENWLENLGLDSSALSGFIDLESFTTASEAVLDVIVKYIRDNAANLISMTTDAGKSLLNLIIAFILSIYMLTAKDSIRASFRQFLNDAVRKDRRRSMMVFLDRCREILSRYVFYNLIDAVIVGLINAFFMIVCRMDYIGLVSVVVAVTNLIPTFGPMIGLGIGAFILLLVHPVHALLFIIFTLVLQLLDGYLLKPQLFGNSLGVSGLLVMAGIVVGGRIAGILGILVATPVVAILDYVYKDILLPRLRRRHLQEAAAAAETETVQASAGEKKSGS